MREKLIPLSVWARQHGISDSLARIRAREGSLNAVRLGRYWYVREVVEEPKGPGQVFTLFTHAGGAGKTSLARDLGFEMASRGRKVLLVDADPQANLTAWLGLSEVDERETILPLFDGGDLPEPKEVLPNLHLIPAHVELARSEVLLSREPHNAFALRAALGRERERYDLILVDSLPSLGSLAAAAALAGDGLIVPVELSLKGLQAFGTVVSVSETYARALSRMHLWSGPSFIRLVVPTGGEGTARDREVFRLLEERLAGRIPLTPPLTRRPAVYREAQVRGVPVQLVGSPDVAEEFKALGDLFEGVLQPEEVSA